MTTQRNSYSFKEGLTMMAAKAVGIDPYLAAEGGENARAAINAIRNAAKTKTPKDRAGFIREAQSELRSISATQHPKLVNALQARVLALQGRGGDTEIAHLTPGEVVIPRSLQTPAVMRTLAMEAHRQRVNPARYSVGNRANSINPVTGAKEFDDPMIEIEVTGKGYPPVKIPRVTRMPYNPWIGRKPFTLGGVYDTTFDAGIDYDLPGDGPEPETIDDPDPPKIQILPNPVVYDCTDDDQVAGARYEIWEYNQLPAVAEELHNKAYAAETGPEEQEKLLALKDKIFRRINDDRPRIRNLERFVENCKIKS